MGPIISFFTTADTDELNKTESLEHGQKLTIFPTERLNIWLELVKWVKNVVFLKMADLDEWNKT